MWIAPGRIHDVNLLDELLIETGAIYVLDRGYPDFARPHRMHRALAFFVTGAKKDFPFRRLYSAPVEKAMGVFFNQTVLPKGFCVAKDFPDKLRWIRFFDIEKKRHLVFPTSNFTLPALSVAQLNKSRWHVGPFSKWIKEHLCIMALYGTCENAVETQSRLQ